ncbi:MAG: non-homologous end-joining DNA ligase [Candidatus Eremiobacteraeota bacterium]|nr:non-homologous end-joining DNA ligase [Candidatus Eremiobacteraeota bacterium]
MPLDQNDATVSVGSRAVRLTNLRKVFWPALGLTKGDLLQYYADVSDVLLPHIKDRAMVMKRYPHGISGDFFFMKRTPQPQPEWLETCSITHGSGNVIAFPMINDVAALLWVINLGCIDLNQWYARCDDYNRPDYLHFDLDPGSAPFSAVRDVALIVRDGLRGVGMPCYAKTSGSKGMHVYVPIVRGPVQKSVWTFAKAFAQTVASNYATLATAEYRIEKRPAGRVLVDYNQNAWGRTLASIYSVRPTPRATVSAPVAWDEVEGGCEIEDFRVENMRERIAKLGDLWEPIVAKSGRFDLSKLIPEQKVSTSRRRRV